jgi:hypothetical protein
MRVLILWTIVAAAMVLGAKWEGTNPGFYDSAVMLCTPTPINNGGITRCGVTITYKTGVAPLNASNFRVYHDGCTHYADAVCPSAVSGISQDANQYSFTFTTPPAIGGQLFTIRFAHVGAKPRGVRIVGGGTGAFAKNYDFEIATTVLTTTGGGSSLVPSVVAGVFVAVLAVLLH